MKGSRIIFLCFRYVTTIIVGVSILGLWELCRLPHAGYWGRFYALWFPLLYAVCSTLYVLGTHCLLENNAEIPSETTTAFIRFCRYDDYTYLLFLGVAILEIAAASSKNLLLWLAILYLAAVVTKGGLFLASVYQFLRHTEISALEPANGFRPPVRLPARVQALVLLAGLLIYSTISAYHIHRTSLTGDEPHYLLIAHSLWHDHDDNLYNNFQHKDYTSFFWYDLQPAWGDQISETEIYSYRHRGGFPFALIPGYVLRGQWGAVFEINLITAILMLQVFLLSYELFHSLTASFFTWICCALTVPFIVYMGQIYPETLAAFLTIWGLRRIRRLAAEEGRSGKKILANCVLIGGILLGLLALKTRYLPLAGILALLWCVYLVSGRVHVKHKLWAAVGSLILLAFSGGGLILIDRIVFGGAFWERLRDRSFMNWILSGHNPILPAFGLFFDQEYGLFTYAPVYVLAVLGIGLLTGKEWRASWPLLAVFAGNYLTICAWPLWHAAPTPPMRYMLPVIPLLAVFFAKFFQYGGGLLTSFVLASSGVWSALMSWFLTLTPGWRYNWADGVNNFFEAISLHLSANITRLFPSWIRPSPLTSYLTGFSLTLMIFLIWFCRHHPARPKVGRPMRFSALYVLGISLLLGILIGGIVLAKKLPTFVLEAEDNLDFRRHGGERVPESFDPWDNQQYLHEKQYQGWKLFAGDALEARPTLLSGELWLDVYASADKPPQEGSAVPIMVVLVNDKEIGRTPVAIAGWKPFRFPLLVEEQRPQITVKCEGKTDTQSAIIIDKIRFEKDWLQEKQ